MLRALLFSVLLALTAWTAPAVADHRDRSYDSASRSAHQREERLREHRRAKHERWKRQRYARQRYDYSYPYTPWWGPFPGPPGL